LVSLGAFAVTQPILSDFQEGAGYFVARRNEPVEIVLLVLFLAFMPGFIANLIVWGAAGLSPKAGRVAYRFMIGVFATLIAQSVLVRLTSLPWDVSLAASVGIGVLAAIGYRRSQWFRSFLTFLIPAPLIFAIFFLATPPVSALVFPSQDDLSAATIESDAPVVFVVFDEFPVASLLNLQGGIDGSRYPNFARLASMSNWYKYTAAAHDNTLYAVPALLTGQMPSTSLLPTAANYPGNLFTLLDDSHDLNVVEPFTHLCPPEACAEVRPTEFHERLATLLIDSGRLFGRQLNPDPTRSAAVSDPFNEFRRGNVRRAAQREFETDQVARFEEFIAGVPATGPNLNFVHLFMPHAPYRYYPSGSQYNDGEQLDGYESEIWVEPALANQAYQRHLLQVQAVDRMIGELLDSLEISGVLDDAIVVVSADHGVSFRPGVSRRPLTRENSYEVGLVPLFIKGPGQDKGVVVTEPARTIDVLPTVASYLDIELPWDHQGESLVDDDRSIPALTVQSSEDGLVTLDEVEAGLRAAVEYEHSVFESPAGNLDPYAIGEYDALVGLDTGVLTVPNSGLVAELEETWRLVHVGPQTGDFVPGFLHGQVDGDGLDGLHVAIAINGEVAAVVPVHGVDGAGGSFSAVIPEGVLVPGFNDVGLLAVSGQDDAPTLESIRLEGHVRFEMESASSGRVTRLVDGDGRTWPVDDSSSVEGVVDGGEWRDFGLPEIAGQDLEVQGWAVDSDELRPAEQIVFFVNDSFAGTADVSIERPDIANAYDSQGVLMGGFVGKLSQLRPTSSLEFEAFALSDGSAVELSVDPRLDSELHSG
jgi:hypothetical protein